MNGRTGQHAQNRVVTVNKHELEYVSMDHVLIHCMKVVHVNMTDVSITSIIFIFCLLKQATANGKTGHFARKQEVLVKKRVQESVLKDRAPVPYMKPLHVVQMEVSLQQN